MVPKSKIVRIVGRIRSHISTDALIPFCVSVVPRAQAVSSRGDVRPVFRARTRCLARRPTLRRHVESVRAASRLPWPPPSSGVPGHADAGHAGHAGHAAGIPAATYDAWNDAADDAWHAWHAATDGNAGHAATHARAAPCGRSSGRRASRSTCQCGSRTSKRAPSRGAHMYAVRGQDPRRLRRRIDLQAPHGVLPSPPGALTGACRRSGDLSHFFLAAAGAALAQLPPPLPIARAVLRRGHQMEADHRPGEREAQGLRLLRLFERRGRAAGDAAAQSDQGTSRRRG